MIAIAQLRSAVLTAALVAASSPLVCGAEELLEIGVAAQGNELSDESLAGLRGRSLIQGRIVRFGVEMASTWQTPAGQTFGAAATLDVSLGGTTPRVTFVPALSAVDPEGAVSGSAVQTGSAPQPAMQVSGASALERVSGVVQSIQVAGDDNRVTNSATVTIGRGASGAPGDRPSGVGQAAMRTASGAVLSATAGPEGMSVAISVPGAGRVQQQIRASREGAVRQMAQITGDLQRVDNRLSLCVVLDRAPAARGLGRPGLDALRSTRVPGISY